MKKYLSLLFVALFATLSLSLTSCGDDDDEPKDSDKIVGTWQENGLSSILDVKSFVQFNSNHTFIEVDDMGDGDVDVKKGKWERNGNTIKISGSGIYTINAEIKKLTATELTLETYGIPTQYKKVSDSSIDKYLK